MTKAEYLDAIRALLPLDIEDYLHDHEETLEDLSADIHRLMLMAFVRDDELWEDIQQIVRAGRLFRKWGEL
jgi:hypothetical protein